MKKILFGLIIAVFTLGFAVSGFSQDDTSVVDLRDRGSDTPSIPSMDEPSDSSDVVYSPSLENETPAGWAPGGPVESDD